MKRQILTGVFLLLAAGIFAAAVLAMTKKTAEERTNAAREISEEAIPEDKISEKEIPKKGISEEEIFEERISEKEIPQEAEAYLEEESEAGPEKEPPEEDWALLLVNSKHPLPEDYEISLQELQNRQQVDERIYPYLDAMLTAMKEEGLSPLICSSYRTTEKQKSLYEEEVLRQRAYGYSPENAEKEAAKWVAPPGTSEHQTGLAVDIVDVGYQILDESQEHTKVEKWLQKNAYRYGFILRYPKDKTELTGIGYEPWHYRYVGQENAKAIWESGLCLEEYLQTQQ